MFVDIGTFAGKFIVGDTDRIFTDMNDDIGFKSKMEMLLGFLKNVHCFPSFHTDTSLDSNSKLDPLSTLASIDSTSPSFDISQMILTDLESKDDNYLASHFMEACHKVASISLMTGYPTQASLPHSIADAFQSLVAISVNLEKYSFAEAKPYKDFLVASKMKGSREKDDEEEFDLVDGGFDMFAVGLGDY
jgi:hypothetical protein